MEKIIKMIMVSGLILSAWSFLSPVSEGNAEEFVMIEGFGTEAYREETAEIITFLENTTYGLSEKLKKYTITRDTETLQTLQDMAEERKEYLIEAMRRDPDAALSYMLSKTERGELETIAKDNIEREVTVEGRLGVIIIDDFERGVSQTCYVLFTSDKKHLNLHPARGLKETLLSGIRLKVKGFQIDDELLFDGTSSLTDSFVEKTGTNIIERVEPLSAIGEQKVLIILYNTTDNPRQPFTPSEARWRIFDDPGNSTNAFYEDQSYNKIWLSGDVVGWYTLAEDDNIIEVADPDVDFSQYSHIVFMRPFGQSSASHGKWQISTDEGVFMVTKAWVNGSSLMDSNSFNFKAVEHELGHSMLGLWHANGLECDDVTIRGRCSWCGFKEYGNSFDIMGVVGGHLNALYKDKLGWLDTSNIITPEIAGQYTLEPIETATGGVKVLKFPHSASENIYVEFRQPIGIDSFLSENDDFNAIKGALLYTDIGVIGDPRRGSQLLDATPGSSTNRIVDFYDAALEPGYTFEDPATGAKITVIFQDADSLTLDFEPGEIITPICPIAGFTATPRTGISPLTVQFSDTSRPQSNISSWSWDFNNDGIIESHEQNPTYTYINSSRYRRYYSVKLKVTTSSRGEDEVMRSRYIVVEPSQDNEEPIADAGPDQTFECTAPSGASATLDGSASSDPDGDVLSYLWTGSFGASNSMRQTVTLPVDVDPHLITLTVDDGRGGSDSDTVNITVQDTTPPDVFAQWVPVNTRGKFRLEFSAEDVCGLNSQITGVMETPSLEGLKIKLKAASKVKVNFDLKKDKVKISGPDPGAILAQLQEFGGLVVTSGQMTEVNRNIKPWKHVFKFDKKGILTIKSPDPSLKVIAKDVSGNTAEVHVNP